MNVSINGATTTTTMNNSVFDSKLSPDELSWKKVFRKEENRDSKSPSIENANTSK